MPRTGTPTTQRGGEDVKRHVPGVLAVLVVIGGLVFSRRQSGPTAARSPERVESAYQASDPGRLAATGRPQLVEFFHHA